MGRSDYVIQDGEKVIGVVREATTEPRFGRNAPTIYLRQLASDRTRS